MFKKKITPFACIVISLLVCAVTFVGVSSYDSVKHKAELSDLRQQGAVYSDYANLIQLIGDSGDKYEKLALLIGLIENEYIRDYDESELWDNIYRTLAVSIGDKYSEYLTAEEYSALIDSSDGEFVGIGVHAAFDIDTSGIYIFGVMPDSPAEKGGLQKGDIIIAANGIRSSQENYYDMLDTIRGESGTEVSVTVLRGEEELDFTLVRADVASENVIYEKLGENIAYIRILSFADESVSEEFAEKIVLAQSDGCDSFVFDVRNNSGGYLEEICAVLDILLPEGPIINIVDNKGSVSARYSDADCIEGEMVVLCNENTASAAELFAAALRDYKLADLVGKTTFGKGTMQSTRLLSDGSAIKYSVAFYNPPSNVSYDGIGIIPDHDISLPEQWDSRFFKMPVYEDTQLQKAVELINSTN